MIFEVNRHDANIEGFENLDVGPCRLIHEDLRVRKHLKYLVVEYATFECFMVINTSLLKESFGN